MDREQAEQALAIIRQVVENTRDDLVARNWGLIWMIHAFIILAAFASLGLVVERQRLPIYWYLPSLALAVAVNLAILLALVKREHGVRSYVEWQLHGIWLSFIGFTALAAALIYLADASPRLYCPLVAMTSGIAFAMMGVVFYRRYVIVAALFVPVMLVGPLIPDIQWLLLGLVWWVGLFVPGLAMHRERRRRVADGSAAAFL